MHRVGTGVPMSHLFLAFTNPEEGVESTFNSWYDSRHVPEVLRYGRGFTGCQRFRLLREVRRGELHPWSYLALYTLESDDLAALANRPWIEGAPPLTPFTGLLKNDHVAWVYSPVGGRVERENASPANEGAGTASFLMLRWQRTSGGLPEEFTLRSAINRVPAGVAMQAFQLAEAQRGNQQSSPWRGLILEELSRADELPSASPGPAWLYTAVSEYRTRESVLASRFDSRVSAGERQSGASDV